MYFSDPNGLVRIVKEMGWLNVAIERTPTPHVLVTWVKEIRRLSGRVSRSSTISFTIRTSRMGPVTALVASLSRSILFTIREADGVSTVLRDNQAGTLW